ncbi:MAG TPA: HAD family hydrolase [Rhodanobacteraceae bacterium]
MAPSVFFDLDYCLCAGDEVGATLYEPVFASIRRANAGALTEAALAEAFAACMRFSFDAVAGRFQFSADMYRAGLRGFEATEVVAPMHGYPDLHALRELRAQRFLVTTGFPKLQQSKITALGIRSCFAAIYVDSIVEQPRRGKQAIFADIIRQYGLVARQVWVVGDNGESEIAAGNQLGMITVQILRPGVERCDTARHAVRSLIELKALMDRRAGP